MVDPDAYFDTAERLWREHLAREACRLPPPLPRSPQLAAYPIHAERIDGGCLLYRLPTTHQSS